MTSEALKRDVLDALDFHPEVKASSIGVSVEDHGVVTLSGHVPTYFEKDAAEEIVKRVTGVRAVANELQVRVSESASMDDTDLAMAIRHALEWNVAVPDERITVLVDHGRVRLEGEVDGRYQREAARRAVSVLPGVKSIDNAIVVVAGTPAAALGREIADALRRDASLAGQHIKAEADGTRVVLTGSVRSWSDRDAAERIAAAARGVTEVENHLTLVSPSPFEV